MSKFLLILVYCLSFSSSEPNCKKIHTGNFISYTSVGNFNITRMKDRQIEKMEGSDLVCEFRLKWKSSCTYLLYDKKVLQGVDNTPKEYLFDTLYCDVIEVKDDKHTVFCHVKDKRGVNFILERVK